MMRLEGKTILVAGGGGIGGGLARRYAQEGANVLLGDIKADAAAKVVDEITAAGGERSPRDLMGRTSNPSPRR